MPIDNCFRHQQYGFTPLSDQFRFVAPPAPADPDSDDGQAQLAAACRKYIDAGVQKIYLVHGTLAGTDLIGINREIARLAPGIATSLKNFNKRVVDRITNDKANYTAEFERQFQNAVDAVQSDCIQIERFHWSSENNHRGRAVAALRLLVKLAEENLQRVMLWGHSHAGNVFALLSHLVGGSLAERQRFLSCFDNWLRRRDEPLWNAAVEILDSSRRPLLKSALDFVNFGTPIRYGWETLGYHQLLHVINHHAVTNPPETAPFPFTAEQALQAASGDYFQQFFVSGTDVAIGLLFRHKNFKHLLENEVAGRSLRELLAHGQRVPEEGLTLLVDYRSVDERAKALAGHAIYTRVPWLPYHAQLIADCLYDCP